MHEYMNFVCHSLDLPQKAGGSRLCARLPMLYKHDQATPVFIDGRAASEVEVSEYSIKVT